MPKKKIMPPEPVEVPKPAPEPEPVPTPPLQPPLSPTTLVMGNMPLRYLLTILINGSHDKMFTVHSGLIQLMYNAYRRKDAEAFITGVQRYLEQAVTHVAQSGRREEIPGRIQDLRSLIEQAGLEAVGQRILSVVHATI
jgi:hypothetical protein